MPAQCQQLLSLLQQRSIVQQPFANMAGSITTTSSSSASTSSSVTGFLSHFLYLNPKYSVFSSVSIPKFPSSNSKSTPWIIDTGATDHMINCPSLFTTIIAMVSTYVKLPNGFVVLVTHIGTVVISTNLTFTEIFCVPSFTFILISASKIIKFLKACLIFLVGYCFIQNLCPWRTIRVGKEEGGLFYLLQDLKVSPSPSSFYSSCFNFIKISFSDVWHYRLGHPSIPCMQCLHNKFLKFLVILMKFALYVL
jgi:hypothetical protein